MIVGMAGGIFDGAFIWDATHGMQNLKAVLESEGADSRVDHQRRIAIRLTAGLSLALGLIQMGM